MSQNNDILPLSAFIDVDDDFVTPPPTPPENLTPPPSPYSENESGYLSGDDGVIEVRHEGGTSAKRSPEHGRKADENSMDLDEQNDKEKDMDDNEKDMDVGVENVDSAQEKIVDVCDQENYNGSVEVNEIELREAISRSLPFLVGKRREPRS